MDTLTRFQLTLLENLLANTEVLRFGHSAPVQDLVEKGFVVKVDELFEASKKVTANKLKKAFAALDANESS